MTRGANYLNLYSMQKHSGFTLVELSIVLVILGLLVGGVLTGQSLIKAAELRSVSMQHQRYATAVNTFRDKYMALPGDMTNATAYWGPADGSTGNTAGCLTTQGTGTQTCNGNGDGYIGLEDSTAGTSPTPQEFNRFWQHLANAGLIEGTFTGIPTPAGNQYNITADANVPRGKFNNGVWTMRSLMAIGASNGMWAVGGYANALQYGKPNGGVWNDLAVMKSEEAYNIDMKMDDGKPITGMVVSNLGVGCTNATGSADTAATYLLSTAANACVLKLFMIGQRTG